MKNKTMKKALLSSVLALVLCFAMLIGTTYAWFTDSVASSGNIIKSGTLDIDLLVKGGDIVTTDLIAEEAPFAGYYSLTKNPGIAVFNYDLWEPGYTDWANAAVVNKGTLALKYTMRIVPAGEVTALAEVIDVYYKPAEVGIDTTDRAASMAELTKVGTLKDVIDGAQGVVISDHLLPEEADYATIVLHMQESAGNEYQNLSVGSDFTIQVLATQYTYEADSFDNQYDKDAEYACDHLTSHYAIIDSTLYTICDHCGEKLSAEPLSTEAVEGAKTFVGSGNGLQASDKTLQELVSEAAATDDLTIVLPAGTYTVSGGTEGSTLKIYGVEDEEGNSLVTIDNAAGASNYKTLKAADVLFENVNFTGRTIDANPDASHACGFAHNGNITYKNCTFTGSHSFYNYGGVQNLIDCTFNIDSAGYAAWIYGNGTYNITGCTFNTIGKALKLYAISTNHETVTISDCTFNATTANKAAVELDRAQNGAIDCTLSGNTLTGEFTTLYNIKNGTNVTVTEV